MNEEEENKALNQEAEEINSRITTPVIETQAPEDVEEAESTEEVQPTETVGESNKGYSKRVQELNQRAKAAEERARSLEERMRELTTPQPGLNQQGFVQADQYNPAEPLIAPGEEIDVNELNRRQTIREQRILQQADGMAQLRTKQSEAITRINQESQDVLKTFPELDPESDTFNEELSDAITEVVENAAKVNPYDVSVKKIVAKQMKLYQGAVAKEVGQASENIARQVSQTALRPTNIRKPEKSTAEMSIEELEQKLGIVQT